MRTIVTVTFFFTVTTSIFAQICKCDSCYRYFFINVKDENKEHNQYYNSIIGENVVVSTDTLLETIYYKDEFARRIGRQFTYTDSFANMLILFKINKAEYEKFEGSGPFSMLLELPWKIPGKNGVIESGSITIPFKWPPGMIYTLGNCVYVYSGNIPIAFPEILSLSAISLKIWDELSAVKFSYELDSLSATYFEPTQLKFNKVFKKATFQDSIYIRGISILDYFENTRMPFYALKTEQVNDLLALYAYTKEYVNPDAFYNREAQQLAKYIQETESKKILLKSDSILLVHSQFVYNTYEETSNLLRSYYDRAKAVLFQNRTMLSTQGEDIFILRKDKREFIFDQNTDRQKISFGAFIMPVRIRFGAGSQVRSDVTIGISHHFSIFGKKRPSDLVYGIGISAINTSDTSSNFLNSTFSAGFSTMVGYAFSPSDNHYQIGLYLGLDFVGGQNDLLWKYNGKPWLGIGFAYRLKKQDRKIARPNFEDAPPFLYPGRVPND